MKNSAQLESQAVLTVASLMAAAARTAPKTRGIDNIETMAIDDDATRQKIIEKMKAISKAENRPSMDRDAVSITACAAILVVGVRSNPAGLNCGFCGYTTCAELGRTKGVCAYNSVDLGIAVASAAAIAAEFHIDNRIMYSIGRACMDLQMFGKDAEPRTVPNPNEVSGSRTGAWVKQALGIPLSATGKNPFFDRK